jgi:hypothetical protein
MEGVEGEMGLDAIYLSPVYFGRVMLLLFLMNDLEVKLGWNCKNFECCREVPFSQLLEMVHVVGNMSCDGGATNLS